MKARLGLLIECDAPLKTWLLHQDHNLPALQKFIIADLDETHLFIKNDDKVVAWILEQMDVWIDSNSFLQTTPIGQAT